MGFTRHRRSLTAWLALFALALNFAWPLVAKASSPHQDGLTDICTAAGLQPADAAGTSNSLPVAASHCGFCPFGNVKAIFAPHDLLPDLVPAPRGSPAGAEIRVPPVASLCLHPAPRAPPSHS